MGRVEPACVIMNMQVKGIWASPENKFKERSKTLVDLTECFCTMMSGAFS